MLPVYTLANLGQATLARKPARLAVIGYPVAHSASPQLHQPALDALGIDASYIRLEVEPGKLSEAFDAMRSLGFIGCNITVPHKFEALDTCTAVSEDALVLGAVNTVVFNEKESTGYNTDGPGIVEAISGDFDLALGETHTLILGAGGGAGQAIATQCALLKAPRLTLVNRTLDKIQTLALRLKSVSPETEINAITFDDPALVDRCHAARLMIQTTSLGLTAGDPPVIPAKCFLPSHFAYDTIYKPAETPFLAAARRTGCRTGNGLSLLLHQGAIAFQSWFPGSDPLPRMREAMKRLE